MEPTTEWRGERKKSVNLKTENRNYLIWTTVRINYIKVEQSFETITEYLIFLSSEFQENWKWVELQKCLKNKNSPNLAKEINLQRSLSGLKQDNPCPQKLYQDTSLSNLWKQRKILKIVREMTHSLLVKQFKWQHISHQKPQVRRKLHSIF